MTEGQAIWPPVPKLNKMTIQAPNGFDKWVETHHEVVSILSNYANRHSHEPTGIVAEYQEKGGYDAMYQLAVDLANDFEVESIGKKWEAGERFLSIIQYTMDKIYV